ncbi:50S ribosomal protein L1 [Novimethylophilus kurashikiensis]|uniref:50S ribosomal protein L1 n=1 Tax=Novimethylophilus kurashikiensis TaxID=1825523 RepID=A0A2R5FCG6_9PROT|nr:50S ribosomal protein L1 [Novimethylophilus kurashikiensis]
MNSNYGFGKTVNLSFDMALQRVTEELQKEGFGVLTDIDVKATLKKKLNTDMPPYRILGACNPPLAHRALTAEPQVGLLLPCNVVVREDDAGKVHVEFMDPNAVLDLVGKPEITQLAGEVRQRLKRVMAALP